MEEIGIIHDLPSPASSISCLHNNADSYLDSSSDSTSTSQIDSPYHLSSLGIYSSPEQSHDTTDVVEPNSQPPATKPSAKRKRENRYKNAPPSVLSRRRAQNRASQRAYRERKDQRIKDLEVMLSEARQRNDILSQAYETLQSEYIKLKSDGNPQNNYQDPGFACDPTMGLLTCDLDMFVYNDQVPPFHLEL